MNFEFEKNDLSKLSADAGELLEIFRSLKLDPSLRSFFRHPDFLEILLIIIELNGDPRYGLGSYIDMVYQRSISQLSLAKFIRNEIEAGRLLVSEGDKRSRKTLVASKSTLVAISKFVLECQQRAKSNSNFAGS
jgi:hypothetical protein